MKMRDIHLSVIYDFAINEYRLFSASAPVKQKVEKENKNTWVVSVFLFFKNKNKFSKQVIREQQSKQAFFYFLFLKTTIKQAQILIQYNSKRPRFTIQSFQYS